MDWLAPATGKRGRAEKFSDAAIQFCLMVKNLFGLALRQACGMAASLLKLSGLDWPTPDYTTICRRQQQLQVCISYRANPMIAPKDRVQDVKAVVDRLKQQQRTEVNMHRKVYRPWGFYDEIDIGDRHKTKRIMVKPGAKLSVQMHHHRAEHWVVVRGTALVKRGDEEVLVSENQSMFIPLGIVHRLENPGVIPLEMIEVQSGSYLGEDDIVRFSDQYGRQLKTL